MQGVRVTANGSNTTPPTAALTEADGLLRRVRSRIRSVLIVGRSGALAATFIAVIVAVALLDYLLRAPWELRFGLWLGGLVLAAGTTARALWPAVRFNPPLTEIALRIERGRPGSQAALGGVLASGVEFAGGSGRAESVAASLRDRLARLVAHQADERVRRLRLSEVVNHRAAVRGLGLAASAVMAIVLFAALTPGLTRIGAARVLTPWSGAEWPRRTGVVDATGLRVHPLGSALLLRAGLTRHQGPLEAQRVNAVYRLVIDGRAGPWQRALLTPQSRWVDESDPTSGTLFERLIEPSPEEPRVARSGTGDADGGQVGGTAGAAPRIMLEYSFQTSDDESQPGVIDLVMPPAVVGASARVTPPEYILPAGESGESDAGGLERTRTLDLGTGIDERATPEALLAGSRIQLTLRLNKPIPHPGEGATADELAAWTEAMLGPDVASLVRGGARVRTGEAAAPLTFGNGGAAWVLDWTLAEPVRLIPRPVDEHGLAARDEAAYRIAVRADNPPAASIVEPAEDRSVLATAEVTIVAEARDDVGLAWLSVERQVARRAAGSEGAAPEPLAPPESFSRVEAGDATADEAAASARARLESTVTLELATLNVKPGDEVRITALAADTFRLGDLAHEPVRSRVRTLRIMSRDELIAQVWQDLAGVRRTAIKIEADQGELVEAQAARRAARSAAQAEQDQRAQAGVTERIARQRDAVEAMRARMEQNGLTDDGLARMVQESGAALRRAGEASKQASEALRREADAASDGANAAEVEQPPRTDSRPVPAADASPRAEARPEGDRSSPSDGATPERGSPSPAPAGQRGVPPQRDAGQAAPKTGEQPARAAEAEQAADAQETVREELNGLIEMLDQGEDAWAARRGIEQLIERQRELEARTAEAAERTTGREADQLSNGERQELERLANEQQEAGRQAAEAIRQMTERSERLARSDPAASQALSQAARRGQREQVAQTMERAAGQISQNQTNSARQQQAKASQSLQQMLDELSQVSKNRDEVLKRFLESLIESLDGLIARQQAELAALDQVMPDGPFSGLDGAMARLHAATLGVLEQADNGPREGAQASRLIEQAADAQGAAVVALREQPAAGEEARSQESISLERLREARAAAERLEEQAEDREQARKAAELKQKYTEALARQVTLRDQVLGLAGSPASRRTRAIARDLSVEQLALRDELAAIQSQTRELSEARMFEYAHRRLGDLTSAAGDALAEGVGDSTVVMRQESAIRVLRSMIAALDNSSKKDRPFRENEQPAGQSGGGQGRTPLVPPAAELKLLRLLQEHAMDLTRASGEGPGEARAAMAQDAGTLQRELAEQGRELLERVKRERGGAGPPVDVQPTRPGEPAEPQPPAGNAGPHGGAA